MLTSLRDLGKGWTFAIHLALSSIAAELARVRAAQRLPGEGLLFVPLGGRYGLIMLVFGRETRTVIDWMT